MQADERKTLCSFQKKKPAKKPGAGGKQKSKPKQKPKTDAAAGDGTTQVRFYKRYLGFGFLDRISTIVLVFSFPVVSG